MGSLQLSLLAQTLDKFMQHNLKPKWGPSGRMKDSRRQHLDRRPHFGNTWLAYMAMFAQVK